MSSLFLVFGTQGAGKTTVLKGIKAAKAVSIGTEMYLAYSRRFGVRNRDEVRMKSLLTFGEMIGIRNAILKKLAGSPGTIALDTHASVKAGDGYMAGLSLKDFEVIRGKVKAIIYIDADSSQILERRKTDKGRKREHDTIEEIDLHRSLNLMYTTLYSLYLQTPVYVVHNGNDRLTIARKRVEEIIRSMK
jgi:adenylate kinase